MRFKGKHLLPCLIIIILSLLVYANSFESTFQYDDVHSLVVNPYIKDPANLLKLFWTPEMGSGLVKETSSYRPLLLVTYGLNFYMGGMNVFGYHLLNTIIHTGCALLVYFITFLILRNPFEAKEADSRRHNLTALLAALIFAIHPVQTESVTYITGRSSSLITLFFLGSFYTYLQYYFTGKLHHLIWSSLIYFCALLVKETAITLVPLLILLNFFFPSERSWKGRIFSLFSHLALSAIYLWGRLYFFGSLQYKTHQAVPSLYEQLLTQLRAWVHYIGTLIFPLTLNVDYDFPISHSIFEGQVILALGILLMIGVMVWRASRTFRPFGFFALWFAITLLPTNSIIPLEDVVTDRWLYLPSVAYAIIFALTAEWIFRAKIEYGPRPNKIIFFFLCALILEFYGYATLLRNFTWHNEWMLWEDAALKSPNKARPHNGLGLALSRTGRLDEAIVEFQRVLELDPKHGGAYLNLGSIYFKQGKLEEAIQALQKSIVLSPRLSPEAYNNLGVIFLNQGKTEEALKAYQQSVNIRPLNDAALYNLGDLYARQGDIDQAIAYMERVIKIAPESFRAYGMLSRLYEKKGWKEKSEEASKKALRHAPSIKYLPQAGGEFY